MNTAPDQGEPAREPEILHQLKNYLTIVLGFGDLLLAELPKDDPHHADVLEIRNAGQAAMALMPDLAKRLD